ncbi:MAG: transposase [Tissierellia bacterium]|nr:transposase [Tissierellia bacterium]
MYTLQTEKQIKYFDQVIKMHYEQGYGEDRISKIIPIGHTTVSRWITIFVLHKGKIVNPMKANNPTISSRSKGEEKDILTLEARIKELESQLLKSDIRAEAYDEMINVAEAKFNIPIRKKAGTKQ